MATLIYSSSGLAQVQFRYAPREPRKTVSIGHVSRKHAQTVLSHFEHLIAHRLSGQPLPAGTAAWVGEIRGSLQQRMIKAGLIVARASAPVELGAFLDRYIAGRTDIKSRTRLNFEQVKGGLVGHFGLGRDIRTITRGEIGDWHRKLKLTLADATVAMHVKKARQMFRDAADRELITANPLAGLKAGKMVNRDRQQYVPAEVVLKVTDACPDVQWKLIFALARFGGLRVPSETHKLRWSDVDWDGGRVTVRSPKTEHHQGRAVRVIPLFPMLKTFLRQAFDAHEDGTVHAITLHRGENLRTRAQRIIERAGVALWPKLFQNLRSSFETDLTAKFPLHVACAWAGNTEAVALSHYLQVTPDHFSAAVGGRAAKALHAHKADMPTIPELQKPKPSTVEGFSGEPYGLYPQGEGQFRGDFGRFLAFHHKKLSPALRALNKAAPYLRQSWINQLETAVRSARRRVARRRAGGRR